MILAEGRYMNNAHRITVDLDPSVTTLYDGQWLQFTNNGTVTIADGTKRAFLTISAKYGDVGASIGAPITDAPAGKDTVTPSGGKAVILIGSFKLETDQFDTTVTLSNYVVGGFLKVNGTGKLTPWVSATDKPEQIVAVCTKAPLSVNDTIGFIAL